MSLSTAFTEDVLDWPTSSQPRHPLWRGGKWRGHDCLSHASHPHASQSRPGRFDKADLENVEVLGQVDKKFIACVFHTEPGDDDAENTAPTAGEPGQKRKVLVLVDQHAADERVRVERFLRELCDGFLQYRPDYEAAGTQPQTPTTGVRTRLLAPPVPVLLTEHEVRRLQDEDVQLAFRRWGLAFADVDDATRVGSCPALQGEGGECSQSGYAQVNVVTVPELLGDKVKCLMTTTSTDGRLIRCLGYSCSLETSCGTS